MKLGLERDEVRILPYDKSWKYEFQNTKNNIKSIINISDKRIEHIGSTAIYKMDSKPIVDIVLGVDSFDSVNKEFEKDLYKIGFLRLKIEKDNEIIFAKFKDEDYKIRTHYLHILIYKDKLWQDFIKFRDILNSQKDLKEEYRNIKLNYSKNKNYGIVDYTNSKKDFVKKVLEIE